MATFGFAFRIGRMYVRLVRMRFSGLLPVVYLLPALFDNFIGLGRSTFVGERDVAMTPQGRFLIVTDYLAKERTYPPWLGVDLKV